MPSTPHLQDGVIVGIDAIDQGPRRGTTILVRHVDAPTTEHPVRVHAGATGNTPPPADSPRPPDHSRRMPGITSLDAAARAIERERVLHFPVADHETSPAKSVNADAVAPLLTTFRRRDGELDGRTLVVLAVHPPPNDDSAGTIADPNSPPGMKPPPIDPPQTTSLDAFSRDVVAESNSPPGTKPPPINPPQTNSPPGMRPPPTDSPDRHEQHNLGRDGTANSGANRIINSGRDVVFGVYQNGGNISKNIQVYPPAELQPPPTKTSSVPPTTNKRNIASAREQAELVRRWETQFAQLQQHVTLYHQETTAMLDVSNLRAEDREAALRKILADQCLATDNAAKEAARVATEREHAIRLVMDNIAKEAARVVTEREHATRLAMAAAFVSTAPQDASTNTPPSHPGLFNNEEVEKRDFVTELANEVANQIKLELVTTSDPPSVRYTSSNIDHGRDFVAAPRAMVMPSTPPTATATTLKSAPPTPTNTSLAQVDTPPAQARSPGIRSYKLERDTSDPLYTTPSLTTGTIYDGKTDDILRDATTSIDKTQAHNNTNIEMDRPRAHNNFGAVIQLQRWFRRLQFQSAPTLDEDKLLSVPTTPSMPTNADSTPTIFGLGVKQVKTHPPSPLEDIPWFASTTITSTGTTPTALTWLTLASFVDLAPTKSTFSFAEALSWIKTAGITNADPTINTFSIVEALSWLMKATFANFDFATTTFSIVEALSWLMKASFNAFHHAKSKTPKGPHHLLHHALELLSDDRLLPS